MLGIPNSLLSLLTPEGCHVYSSVGAQSVVLRWECHVDSNNQSPRLNMALLAKLFFVGYLLRGASGHDNMSCRAIVMIGLLALGFPCAPPRLFLSPASQANAEHTVL